ncbi:MAG TPA: SDR family oxidoreductase [Pyrinomonadaceae bacterium]|nr:SDR family oxidoreductase [Pyrinomonadaceae bacterium]
MSKVDRPMAGIAVVGVSALFPGSSDARGFWADILAGRDLITDVPPTHWLIEDYYDPDPSAPDKTYCKRGAFISPVDFDPMEFGLPPNAVPSTDTTQILALMVAQQLLEDVSQGALSSLDRERISVILGVTSGQQLLNSLVSRIQRPIWTKALRENGIPEDEANKICDDIARNYVSWDEASFPGLLGNVVAGRIANRFDLHGTNTITDAACASSIAAVSMGINELQLGQSDLVISGGVDMMNDIFMYMCFSKTPALSPSGDCRPFSDSADGTLLGEGIGMMALKRLDDAERDGDRIYAVIRGIGASSDGRSTSVYAPLPEGQLRAIRRAYDMAGYGPETVELVEAHGTGTKVGDAAEFEALRQAFSERSGDAQWCALGSVKSQIGHTKAAAGAAGLFKAIMALHHKVLPPTIKIQRPNPALDLEHSPFYLNTQARPWIRDGSHPRRASVSSFGFGGSNFHVTIEEYVPKNGRAAAALKLQTSPAQLVLVSAPSATDLISRCRALMETSNDLVQVARESQESFNASDNARLAVTAESSTELTKKLQQAVSMIAKESVFVTPTGISYESGPPNPGKIAFLFPGQGSQYVGMGADLALSLDMARAVWDEAGVKFDGESVDRIVFPPPVFSEEARDAQAGKLTATEWAQVAMGVQSAALLKVLSAVGVKPDCVAGHSFGEVTALYAAGAFHLSNLVKIARRRGELMRDASSKQGAMAAVMGPIETVRRVLEEGGSDVVIANHNAPSQCVLSGPTEEIEQIEKVLTARGASSKRLPVATAFHSSLVAASVSPFAAYLEEVEFASPGIDVYGTSDATVYPQDPQTIRENLASQIAQPVRFVDQIEAMYERGVRTFIEVGAGNVLTDLVGAILTDREHRRINLDRKGANGFTVLLTAFGRLCVAGVSLNLESLWAEYKPSSAKKSKKPAMVMQVSGVNYGKPYPPPGGAKDLPRPNPPRPAAPPVPVLNTPPVAAPPMPEVQNAWLAAYQEAQRQTAEAHAAYERTMAETHLAFLKTAETSLATLTSLLTGTPQLSNAPISFPLPIPVESAASSQAPSMPPPIAVEPTPQSVEIPVTTPSSNGSPAQPVIINTPVEQDLAALLLGVVAEKTGYPAEMLTTEMEMEADLGIDSIKRVEILSAMSERVAGLRELKMSDFGHLRTLGQIVEYMNGHGNETDAPSIKEAPSTNDAPPSDEAAIKRYALRQITAPAPGVALAGLFGVDRVAITDDGTGLASVLAKKLATRGINASVVSTVPNDTNAVIFLGGMRAVSSIDVAMNVNREAFRAARAVASRFGSESGGIFINVQDTGGDFGLRGSDSTRAWLGGVSALVRTAALEWPNASVRTIDCERGDRDHETIAEAICAELFEGGSTLEVGLRADGTRTTLATVAMPAEPSASLPLGPDSVVVVSGGGRGVTAAALVALARACRPRIVLLGRTTLAPESTAFENDQDLSRALIEQIRSEGREATPSEILAEKARVLASHEIRATIDAVTAAGSQARYLTVDVQDEAALASALDTVRREWGPITAIVHGAGVLADKRIAEKTDEQFNRVFDTKVVGLRGLLAATTSDPVSTLCLFSSVAARTGNPGQADYAMANEVLNLVACAERSRRGNGCNIRSIGWGPWDGGMVTPGLKTHFQQLGVPLIPIESGAKLFVDELRSASDDVAVVLTGANGHGLLGADSTRVERVEICVNAQSHPYLADHRLGDVVVVPVVMALEWMLRGARASRPDLIATAVRNVRVLSGIKIHDFERAVEFLVVNCREISNGNGSELSVELRGRNGTLHYSSVVQMSVHELAAPATPSAPELEPWTRSEIYDGHVLFHREGLHVIQSLDGISAAGIAGTLTGASRMNWPAGPWCTDPAALDGGLQLAAWWTHRVLGGASLPMALGELRLYRQGLFDGPVRCLVHARAVHSARSVCDISFADSTGTLIAQMLGVESVLRPVK